MRGDAEETAFSGPPEYLTQRALVDFRRHAVVQQRPMLVVV
jgi:hypothetical protein